MIVAKLSNHEAQMIAEEIRHDAWEILIAFDPVDKAFKFKVNNGVWSPPFGEFQQPDLASARDWVDKVNHFTALVAYEWRKQMRGGIREG